MGTVEYAGTSIKPNHRFKEHKSKPGIGKGKFYKRLDVFQHVVCGFEDKKQALEMEVKLQRYWGLQTDNEKRKVLRTKESKEKISKSLIGKKRKSFSEEHKKRLSEAGKRGNLKRWLDGL